MRHAPSDHCETEPADVLGPNPHALWTRPFLILLLSGLANFLAVGAVAPLLPRYVTDTLGQGDFMVGLIIGCIAFSAVAARPASARVANRRGRRYLAIAGAGVTCTSLAAYALVPNVALLGAARLATGVGQAMYFTGAATMLTELAPDARRGEAISYFSVAVYLGNGVGPAIGEFVYSSTTIATAFLVAAAFGLLATTISLRLPETMPPDDRDDDPAPIARVHRASLVPGVVLALGMVSGVAFASYMPLYADALGVGVQWVFLLWAVTVILVRAFGARLPDVLGPGRSGTIATLSIAAGMSLITLFSSPAGLYAGAVVFALGVSFHYPSLMSLVIGRTVQRDRSAAIATFTAFFDISTGIGGLAMGTVAAFGGYRSTFAASALAALASLVVLRLVLLRPQRGPAITPAAPAR